LAREANLSLLIHKHLFYTARLELDCGEAIPATVSYATYGRLNSLRNNAILICHHLTGTSHAAGATSTGATAAGGGAPGWWDGLIGPGKPFDTDRYCIIVVDSLCHPRVRDPLVVTTGPATLHPATGKPYGGAFPPITLRDNVRLQYQLLSALGIEELVCVAGPSTGGFQALEWAVTYPDMVQQVVAAAAAPQCPPVMAMALCQAGIDAITADPADRDGDYVGGPGPEAGLEQALLLYTTLARSDVWIEDRYGRRTATDSPHPRSHPEGRFAFQAELAAQARTLARLVDPHHYQYTARAIMLHDIGYGHRGLEVAAQMIKADLLLLPVVSDLLVPPSHSFALAELVTAYGGRAVVAPVEAGGGHLTVVEECGRLAEPITRFLRRNELH
jgi:homoserine O-acetyltransferase